MKTKIQLPPKRATKLQLALLLLHAEATKRYMLTDEPYVRDEQDAEWCAKHSTLDELMQAVILHNMSVDDEGNPIDPYRNNKIIGALFSRYAEFCNFTDDERKQLSFLLERRWQYGKVITDDEFPEAYAFAKKSLRASVKYVREDQTLNHIPKPFNHEWHGTSTYTILQAFQNADNAYFARLEDVEAIDNLSYDALNALGGDYAARKEVMRSTDQAIAKRFKSDAQILARLLFLNPIVYHAWKRELHTGAELTREDRTAIQRAIVAGILKREDSHYKKA